MEQQKVIVLNKHGEELVVLLHDTGSKEIVILCHGFRSTKEQTTLVNLAVALEKEGISVFRFDFAGNGFASPRHATPRHRTSTSVTLTMAHSSQNPVVEQQKVIVPNKHGEKLVGLLHDTGSKDIVILCHGYGSTKEQTTMVNLAAALEKGGISVFRFDFAGNGESEGTFEYGNYWREAEDLRAVIEHFSRANLITRAILGHSKGGDVVLLYASKYHDIPSVVNVSGRYDLKKGISERFGTDFLEKIKQKGFFDIKDKNGSLSYRVTEPSLMDRLNTDMHEACLQIDKDCRVVTVHGTADEIIPVEDAFEFAKIIPNHKLHIIEGANHSYTSHQDELASIVVDFLKVIVQQDE